MRDLARSMMRFSWTMSLFGVRQAVNLVSWRGGTPGARAVAAFDEVSDTTEMQLEGPVRGLYRAGERLQSSLLDLGFGALATGRRRTDDDPVAADDRPLDSR